MSIKKICIECGETFLDWPSGRKKYCSVGCYRPPLYKRLIKNLKVSPNGCWLWTGWKDKDGYGKMTIMHGKKWKSELVPRVVFKHFRGSIEPGNLICHTCDTPACFRPSHIYQGTYQSNMDDKMRRGRNNPARGERSGHAKLTQEQVLEIRERYSLGNITQRRLAVLYGVGYKAISKVILKQRWAHV